MEKAFVYGMSVDSMPCLLCNGIHSGFNTQSVVEQYPLGSKSNVDRIKKCLIDRELITIEREGIFLADCIFELWFKREMM